MITVTFNHVSKRGKDYIYEKEKKDGGIYTGTEKEATEQFNKDMFNKYNRLDPSPDIDYVVKEIIINSIVQVNNELTKIDGMPMKQSSQLKYNFIDEYKNFLQNNGTCVVDNFIGMYGDTKYFKKIF